MDSEHPIAVDLFAGAGGFSLGVEQAGFEIVAAVDIDPIHCATHANNFPHCTVICDDIRKVSGEQIRNVAKLRERVIDVVVGGSPCQGFSEIGPRSFYDGRNQLVFEFCRLVIELKPMYFVFENVRGLAFEKHRSIMEAFFNILSKAGYSVRMPWRLLNAADFGIPQNRYRVFLLGSRADLEPPDYPKERVRRRTHKCEITPGSLPEGPSVWDAISDLPMIENHPELFERDWANVTFGEPSPYARILRDGCNCKHSYRKAKRRSAEEHRISADISHGMITCSLRTRHSTTSVKRFEATPHGQTEPVSRFRRLHPDGVSSTLRAGTGKERGRFTSARPIHPFSPRCLTVREAARLHSYPDWFRFNPTNWHGFRQVGNSVPPLLAKAVAEQIFRILI